MVDVLWPEPDVDTALPRLHKAAHFARQALGERDAVVLRDEVVALFPGAAVELDVATFEAADGPAAIALYRGELLPEDLDEPWADEPRLQTRYAPLCERVPAAPAPVRERSGVTLVERDAELAMLERTVFAGTIVVLRRRRYDGACACFGGLSETVSYVGAVRNLGLIAIVLGALATGTGGAASLNVIWAVMAILVGVVVAIVAIHLEDLAYLLT
jgi:hypothetical protein